LGVAGAVGVAEGVAEAAGSVAAGVDAVGAELSGEPGLADALPSRDDSPGMQV
jgi:hypothetical protein